MVFWSSLPTGIRLLTTRVHKGILRHIQTYIDQPPLLRVRGNPPNSTPRPNLLPAPCSRGSLAGEGNTSSHFRIPSPSPASSAPKTEQRSKRSSRPPRPVSGGSVTDRGAHPTEFHIRYDFSRHSQTEADEGERCERTTT